MRHYHVFERRTERETVWITLGAADRFARVRARADQDTDIWSCRIVLARCEERVRAEDAARFAPTE